MTERRIIAAGNQEKEICQPPYFYIFGCRELMEKPQEYQRHIEAASGKHNDNMEQINDGH